MGIYQSGMRTHEREDLTENYLLLNNCVVHKCKPKIMRIMAGRRKENHYVASCKSDECSKITMESADYVVQIWNHYNPLNPQPMPLTETEKAKIRQEAEKEASLHFNPKYSLDSWQACVSCYTAAVTAERERAKVLLDAANKIKTWIVAHPKKATIYRPVIEEFFNAINKYEQ